MQISYGSCAHLVFIMVLRALDEFFALSEDGIDQSGEFVGGGGDGLARTEACRHAPVIGAQGALTAVQSLGGELQRLCHAIGYALRHPRDAFAAGNVSAGTQAEARRRSVLRS